MKTLTAILMAALFAAAGPVASAADKPARQTQEKKAQQAKDKPQGEQSGAKRKRSVPET
jgi:Ni/Co efflux regulator RcnB